MKTSILKQTLNITLYCAIIFSTIIIAKNTIKNIKQLYGNEKHINTAMTCFADLIY